MIIIILINLILILLNEDIYVRTVMSFIGLKNNFTLYFKISWILFLAVLPLLSFILIDIKLQTLKFLWNYVFFYDVWS